jgi:hypothetical protein
MSSANYAAALIAANNAINVPLHGFSEAFNPVPLMDKDGMALLPYQDQDDLLAQAIPVLESMVASGQLEEISEAECVWVTGDT